MDEPKLNACCLPIGRCAKHGKGLNRCAECWPEFLKHQLSVRCYWEMQRGKK